MNPSVSKTCSLEEEYYAKIAEVASIADKLPGVLIIHDVKDGKVVWMCDRGLQQIGATLTEVQNLSPEEYYNRYFNPDDTKDYVPKILSLLQSNNDDEICSYFQQVRLKGIEKWQWHISSTRIFSRDESGLPILIITMSCPMDAMHHVTIKAGRLLEEKNFIVSHYKYFARLSNREKEILKLLVTGRSSSQIADALFISSTTADTHRRNIKRKLNANSSYELSKYAHAFDLV